MGELIMFDFSSYYDMVAQAMPSGARLCEVGVANGDSALHLAQKMKERSKSFTLYMVDNMDYGKYFQMKTIYENIIKSGLGEYIEVMPYDSLEACAKFNDGFLDFVFIDSSHLYEQTKKEISAWYNKVKDLGYLAGHDYNAPEVNQAVNEVIPKTITRNDIPDRNFAPEQFLHYAETERNYGVWYVQKDFYKHFNK